MKRAPRKRVFRGAVSGVTSCNPAQFPSVFAESLPHREKAYQIILAAKSLGQQLVVLVVVVFTGLAPAQFARMAGIGVLLLVIGIVAVIETFPIGVVALVIGLERQVVADGRPMLLGYLLPNTCPRQGFPKGIGQPVSIRQWPHNLLRTVLHEVFRQRSVKTIIHGHAIIVHNGVMRHLLSYPSLSS